MERSSQDRPSVALDLSQRNSLLASPAAMDLVKQQPGWHSRLTRSRHSTSPSPDLPQYKPAAAPKPLSFTPGRSLPAVAGVKAAGGGGGVRGGRGPEPGGRGVNRDRHPDSGRTLSGGGMARELFHAGGLRGGGAGGLWDPGLYDPDLSDSPSAESSGGEEGEEDSQSDSDVIFLVSSTREDTLVSQQDSSLCSSLDRDGVSSEDRDLAEPLSPAAASLDHGRGCFLLPRPLSSPSSDSASDASSSDSDILPPSTLLLMSELSAVYDNSASSPLDISSDDDDSDVIEVPVTNERTRATPGFPLDVYNQRRLCQQAEGAKHIAPPRPRGVRRSSRAPKPILTPERLLLTQSPTPTRMLYSREAKRFTRSAILSLQHSESYDSGDMMNSTEKQTSSEEEEEEEEEAAWSAVARTADWDSDADSEAVGGAPSDSQSPSEPRPPRRGLSSVPRARSQQPGLPSSTPMEASRQTRAEAPLPGARQRLTKRKPCQRTATPPAAATHQPPKHSLSGGRASAGKTAGKTKPPPARRRRKKPKPGGGRDPSSSLFSPEELEIQLKYARRREERRESRSDGFRPFVRVAWRECTVVNSQEEAQEVGRGSSRAQQGGGPGSRSAGLVPRTSCHQLGRLSSQSRAEASQVCCLCGGPANAMALGDLHGPYYPAGPGPDERSHPREDQGGRRDRTGSPSDPGVRPAVQNGTHSLSNGRCHSNEAGDVEEEEGRAEEEQEQEEEEDRLVLVSDGEGFTAVPSAEQPRTAGSVDDECPGGPRPEPPPHSPGGPRPEPPPHSPGGPRAEPPPHSPGGPRPEPPPHSPGGPRPEPPPHSPGGPRPEPPPHSPGPPGERWVHEDCGVWSAGVFLVKGRLYGLEEAVWLARETVCTTCHRAGATMGCFLKGCPTKYHYRCAVQSGCSLNEENFSMRCPKHKNQAFRGLSRLTNR